MYIYIYGLGLRRFFRHRDLLRSISSLQLRLKAVRPQNHEQTTRQRNKTTNLKSKKLATAQQPCLRWNLQRVLPARRMGLIKIQRFCIQDCLTLDTRYGRHGQYNCMLNKPCLSFQVLWTFKALRSFGVPLVKNGLLR